MSGGEHGRGAWLVAPHIGVRMRAFWIRHRTLFWSLHSVWALATGVAVVWLAHERYEFVPWVAFFLLVTWTSTLLFGSRLQPDEDTATASAPTVGHEAASYVTRILYQETLFFLLPFYAYSTVVGTLNTAFLGLLGALALLSCLDLVFDRLLRKRPVFAIVFFTTVAFAALNLVLPLILPIDPNVAITIAVLVAAISAVPLSIRAGTSRKGKWLSLVVGLAMLLVALFVPSLVPPVPLRLEASTFSRELDRETLEPVDPLSPGAASEVNLPVVFVLLEIFAPSTVPASVSIEWRHDGRVVRTSRDIEITAHEGGFRVWDAWRNEAGDIPPGHLEVDVRTERGRIFGRVAIDLLEAGAAR